MADVTPMPSIALDKRGLPVKHWSGCTKGAEFVREYINEHKPQYITANEAMDLAEGFSRAYLEGAR